MICPKCGTQNQDESKFCIACGTSLEITQMPKTEPTLMQNNGVVNQPSTPPQTTQPVYNPSNINTNTQTQTVSITDYFFIILAILMKPFTALQEELNKFNQPKNSVVLSLVISIVMTFMSLIKTIISTVRVTSYWSDETKWVWENLKEINYLKTVGLNILIYLGIIFAIAGIYYVGSLIIKKQSNFSRLLGIAAISTVPMLLSFNLLSPLLTMLNSSLGMIITIIGLIYTIIILYEGMNKELLLEKDTKSYFNLICLSILAVALYYLYMKVAMSTISGELSGLLDLFS